MDLNSTRLQRRTLLFGLAGVAGTAILAACGSSDATPAATTAPTTAAGAATRPAGSATTAAPAATAATTAPAPTSAASSATTGTASATTGGTSAAAIPTIANPAGGATIQLTGAGSTFINPLMTSWAEAYNKSVAKNITVNYQSIGSGGGIQQFTQKTVDFGATDAPMTEDQLKAAPGVLHIPLIHGAVVPTYNLKLDASKPLQFSGQTLVDIYLGKITKWNDKAIAADNPGVTLPSTDIAVVYRSDGSGTTYTWVDYFSKVSKEWESQIGRATTVKFPVGIGAKGNEGVSGQVKQVEGSIGYVELIYALENKLPAGAVKNLAGEFAVPSLDSVTKAAAVPSYPPDLRFSITQPPAEVKGAYPISATTWALAFTEQPDMNKAQALVAYLLWSIGPAGDDVAKGKNYAPMPASLKQLAVGQLKKMTVKGEPVLK